MKPIPSILISLKEHTLLDGGGPDDDGLVAVLKYKSFKNGLRVIVSWGDDWDHVSVSLDGRCPLWSEMCFVKDFFFLDTECVVQYHPTAASYINNFPNCLHLWRPHTGALLTPPIIMV